MRELYAGGDNLATNSFDVGLLRSGLPGSGFPAYATDIKETASSADLTFSKVGGPLAFEVGLFHQDVDNYIFARFLEEETDTGVPHRLLLYTAAVARFTGNDGQVIRENSFARVTRAEARGRPRRDGRREPSGSGGQPL